MRINFFPSKDIYTTDIQSLIERFPVCKNIFFDKGTETRECYTEENFKDTEKLYNLVKKSFEDYRDKEVAHFSQKKLQSIKEWLKEHPEESDPDIVFDSKNGYSVKNLKGYYKYPGCLVTLNSDLSILKTKSNTQITLVVNNMSDLPLDVAKRLKEENVPCRILMKFVNSCGLSALYTLNQYIEVWEGMKDLLKDVDPNLPELQRFAQIYKKVAESIEFDDAAFTPKTREEKKYAEANKENSANLINGLIKKKTKCSGYAEILRNACLIMGIDAEYIGAPVDMLWRLDWYKKMRKDYKSVNKKLLYKDDEKVVVRFGHAFNKVCINGIWYNCDPTWDHNYIKDGQVPLYCLLSDMVLKKDRQTIS